MLESWFLLDRLKNETHFKTAEARVRCSLSDQVSIGVCFSFRRCWTPDILSSSELNGSPQSSLLFGEKHRTLQPVSSSALLSCVCRLFCSPSRLCLVTADWETMKQPRVLWSWETWSDSSRWQWPSWERTLWCILMGFQRGRARLALHILFFISCSCRSLEKLFIPKTAIFVKIQDISNPFTELCFASFSSFVCFALACQYRIGLSFWNYIFMIFVSSGRTEDQ